MTDEITISERGDGLIRKQNSKGVIYFINGDGDVVCKACTRCGEVKGLSQFTKAKTNFAGRSSFCRDCRRRYREENKDYISSQFKVWYYANREKMIEYTRDWRENNRDHIKEYDRMYREENKEDIAARTKEYRKKNKVRKRLQEQRRKARKNLLPDTLTPEQLEKVIEKSGSKCFLTDSPDYQLDHAIPIKIGHGGTTVENVYLLRSDLNTSKGALNIFEWFRDNHDRFGLSEERFDKLIEYLAEKNNLTKEEYRDFVYWCFDNPRTLEQLAFDNELNGRKISSVELWNNERRIRHERPEIID